MISNQNCSINLVFLIDTGRFVRAEHCRLLRGRFHRLRHGASNFCVCDIHHWCMLVLRSPTIHPRHRVYAEYPSESLLEDQLGLYHPHDTHLHLLLCSHHLHSPAGWRLRLPIRCHWCRLDVNLFGLVASAAVGRLRCLPAKARHFSVAANQVEFCSVAAVGTEGQRSPSGLAPIAPAQCRTRIASLAAQKAQIARHQDVQRPSCPTAAQELAAAEPSNTRYPALIYSCYFTFFFKILSIFYQFFYVFLNC